MDEETYGLVEGCLLRLGELVAEDILDYVTDRCGLAAFRLGLWPGSGPGRRAGRLVRWRSGAAWGCAGWSGRLPAWSMVVDRRDMRLPTGLQRARWQTPSPLATLQRRYATHLARRLLCVAAGRDVLPPKRQRGRGDAPELLGGKEGGKGKGGRRAGPLLKTRRLLWQGLRVAGAAWAMAAVARRQLLLGGAAPVRPHLTSLACLCRRAAGQKAHGLATKLGPGASAADQPPAAFPGLLQVGPAAGVGAGCCAGGMPVLRAGASAWQYPHRRGLQLLEASRPADRPLANQILASPLAPAGPGGGADDGVRRARRDAGHKHVLQPIPAGGAQRVRGRLAGGGALWGRGRCGQVLWDGLVPPGRAAGERPAAAGGEGPLPPCCGCGCCCNGAAGDPELRPWPRPWPCLRTCPAGAGAADPQAARRRGPELAG
jgi:hypothetical protein